jgi:REP element-mobilizing transposase RayT
MSSHTRHSEAKSVYFCTVTCYQWLNLIQEANAYHAIYRWFRHLKNDGCHVTGYVIMPNHFHVLLYLSHSGTSLNLMVGECKRFMAYNIVGSLKAQGNTELLAAIAKGVPERERHIGKLHQVFKPSFDGRLCHSEWMLEQKLDYMHHNPVRGKWNLVEDFTAYPHSSAAFYELGEPGIPELVHYKSLGDK